MHQLILLLHILTAAALVALVLVQNGKGADMGSNFGGGASSTVFGSVGQVSFLVKLTTCLAIIFFATSLGLAYLGSHSAKPVKTLSNGGITQLTPPVAPKTPSKKVTQ